MIHNATSSRDSMRRKTVRPHRIFATMLLRPVEQELILRESSPTENRSSRFSAKVLLFSVRPNEASEGVRLGGEQVDQGFHNLGVGMKAAQPDIGREAGTNNPADRGKFKTPGLRNVARTHPYRHDGKAPTLEAVVEFHNAGGVPNPNLSAFFVSVLSSGMATDQREDLLPQVRNPLRPHLRQNLYPQRPCPPPQ
jgi:hypothetical protein